MVALSSYWASVGIRVDNKDLSEVDAYLAKIENKLKQGINNSKVAFTPKINIPAFEKHIRSALRSVGTGDKNALRVNVRVSESDLRKSIEKAAESKPINAKVLVQLDKSSVLAIKEQLRKALSDLTINARLASVTSKGKGLGSGQTKPETHNPPNATETLSQAQLNTIRRQVARGITGDNKSPEYWNHLAKLQTKTQEQLLSQLQSMRVGKGDNSWSPNPRGGSNKFAKGAESLSGRQEKSSPSTANRRISDVMMRGIARGVSDAKLAFTPRINVPAFDKHLRQVLRAVGAGGQKALRINVRVSESLLRKSIENTTLNKPVDIKVSAKLDPNSLAGIKDQLKKALSNLIINARLGNVLGKASAGLHRSPQKQNTGIATGDALSNAQLNTIRRQIARGSVGNSNSPEYWSQLAKLQVKTQQELLSQLQKIKSDPKYSWSPNPSGRGGTTPHLTEWLAGRPDKSSLSAANRRYSDVIMNQGFLGASGAPNTLRGFAGESVLGGLGRAGSSTGVGRGLSSLGGALGGARLGAVGLIAGAALKGITSTITGVWSSLGKMVSVPFQLIGSASSAVTGAFYRIALAAAPLLMAFNGIDRQVREQTLQGVALGSMASKYGSDLQTEREWLMNMSNRDGVEYASIIQPFTSFLSASAPAMGFDRSKSIFEALTQYGLTHGANDYSMQNALKAFGQMSGKGTVQLEELN